MNSNGKIKKENWTLTAQEMIDSIRAVDTKHTILFGDVQWYDIKELETREPFTDDNIVYVIHSYEPFVFTHQGASWGETATLKNIPFPYDSTKWSTFSSDFGVKKNTASWVKTAVKNYYKTGSKEYIINLILPAKKWAVTNNVPIIINEYGAYGLRADTESRLNYMRAMHEISDTLQIPMQHWGYEGGFSLFENGKLIDGMKEAMGL
jgi:licheninase